MSFSFARRLTLTFLLTIFSIFLVLPSLTFARDPHPRKVRVKNDFGNSPWATPVVYGSSGRLRDLIPEPDKSNYCPTATSCNCFFAPAGPSNTRHEWIKISRSPSYGDWGYDCYAPPYSTSGDWWNWLSSDIRAKRTQNEGNIDQLPYISMYFGIDGEARPLKSGDGWSPTLETEFKAYVPAVVGKVLELYPGKTIRAHTDPQYKDVFLEAEVDFHRESLGADEVHAYLYEGLQWTEMGWWQGFADNFWITNSLGLNPQWPPMYLATLSALSKHTDTMTGGLVAGEKGITENFINFTKSYFGRDIQDTPGVWIHLRDTMVRKKEWYPEIAAAPACGDQTAHPFESFADNFSGKYGDYDFYLYRPEPLVGNQTVPVKASDLPYGTKDQIYSWGWDGKPFNTTRVYYYAPCPNGGGKDYTFTKYVGRKVASGSRYMSFDIDDGYEARFAGQPGVSYDFRIVFLDLGTEPFKLQYKDKDGQWKEKSIAKTNTQLWKEISINVTDAVFNNGASEGANAVDYPTDFRLDFGNPTKPTVIHLIEVRGKAGVAKEETRPKAQVGVDLIRNRGDDPQKGIYSVGLNQTFWVKATLKDNQGAPIPNERIMFTYNTEWNLAKSALTDQNGVAYQWFSTANNPNSSGFLAGGGVGGYKASSYSVQAYFPGSEGYQPSRNDAKLWVTDSPSKDDPRNLRMEIIGSSTVQGDGKIEVTYQLYDPKGKVYGQTVARVGKKEGFYADDANAQTVSIFGLAGGHFGTSNQVTLYGSRNGVPAKVENVGVGNGPGQGQVTVTWQKNADPNNASYKIAGYRIFYGKESGKYTKVFGVGNTNSAIISGLQPGTAYSFSVRAHNNKAYEGDYSAEISKTVGDPNNALTVLRSGLGSGTVTGSGISCGSDCKESYTAETSVTLTATADAGSVFVGWSGGGCTGTGTCSLTMNANKTVTATFNKGTIPPGISYKIAATADTGGTINPPGEVMVSQGGSQAFSITANIGYYVADVKVDGVSKGAFSTYTFNNVTANHTIAATLSVLNNNQYALMINQTGTGSGTVISSPSGPVFNAGTVVTLTATASAGSVFEGWSGACVGTSSTCTVTMNANRSAAATFTVKDSSIDPKRGIFDLNGDGKAEILWQHQTQGDVYAWYMDGPNLIRDEHIATVSDDLSWKIVGVGDFNGDGKSDILWHHQQRGEVYVWFMDGTSYVRDQHIRTVGDDLNWKIVGVGDFNGNGKPDILWHHQQRGDVYVWFMDGTTFVRDQHIRTINDDLLWKIVGVGDFNGDGKPDILWHHQQRGDVYVWYMDGAKFLYDKYIRTVPEIEWQIEAIGDYNGDGKADILWRNQRTGEVYVWYMDGATFVRDQLIRIVEDTDWKIVN